MAPAPQPLSTLLYKNNLCLNSICQWALEMDAFPECWTQKAVKAFMVLERPEYHTEKMDFHVKTDFILYFLQSS